MILLYHRIASLPSDPQKLCVSPERFDEHLSILCSRFRPIDLEQLSSDLRSGRIPDRSFVITFDDGYADNLLYAKSLLEKHGVPATVFVVSDWVGTDREFHWDDLERILLATPELPNRLETKIHGQMMTWDLSDGKQQQATATGPPSPSPGLWDVEVADDFSPRHRAYRDLLPLLRDADSETRERTLDGLATWAGVGRVGRANHRTLTLDELRILADGGLVDLGAHTRTHARLSQLSPPAQEAEITGSKKRLEEMLDCRVRTFSYPFGGIGDYNEVSVKLVKEAGFSCVCSNFASHVHRWADPFQLPRFLVRNWAGDEFERHLAQWW